MNAGQRRFAEEYSVDHNGAAAAVRAGYASRRGKQTATRLLQKPDVADLVMKLDAAKRDDLGITAASTVEEVNRFIEGAFAGKYPASVGMRGLELKAKLAGLLVERVEQVSLNTYTLKPGSGSASRDRR